MINWSSVEFSPVSPTIIDSNCVVESIGFANDNDELVTFVVAAVTDDERARELCDSHDERRRITAVCIRLSGCEYSHPNP